MQLDQRTDRVLPNGWCLLPPRAVCDKGNACLTCDLFVTDASHLDTLNEQHTATVALVDQRQQAFTQRHGHPMTDDHALAGIPPARTHSSRSADRQPPNGQRRTRRARPRRASKNGRTHFDDRHPRHPRHPPPPQPASLSRVMTERADHLRQLARDRHDSTASRAQAALSQLLTEGRPITFRAVAQHGQVSLDFLYRNVDLRQQIQRHRNSRTPPSRPSSADSTIIQAAQIRRLRLELADSRRELEVAHGELLRLRRQRPAVTATSDVTYTADRPSSTFRPAATSGPARNDAR